MRPIHLVHLDKPRPALLLTRESSESRMQRLTFAAITSTIKGLGVEVPVGPANGLDKISVASMDTIQTVAREVVGRQIGWLLDEQEPDLARAIAFAFDLRADYDD